MITSKRLGALEAVAHLAAEYKRQFAAYNSPTMPMSEYAAAFDGIQAVKAALFAALDELEAIPLARYEYANEQEEGN